jgi:hypothetical protein
MAQLRGPHELGDLNRQVTRMMLELEEVVPDAEKPGRFLEIREVIGSGLKLGRTPQEG